MPGAHETHATIHAAAALVLSLGGAAIVVRAWFDRRAGGPAAVDPALAPRSATIAGPAGGQVLVAVMSGGAAAIHIAAAGDHIETLGDLGLAFYWAALFQAGLAVAWLAERRHPRLALLGIVGNGLLVGAWAWSRTVGLPSLGGAEAVGLSDAIAVLLEIGVVAVLTAEVRGYGLRTFRFKSAAAIRTAATSGLVATIGVALLATTVGIVDATRGHHAGATTPHAADSHP